MPLYSGSALYAPMASQQLASERAAEEAEIRRQKEGFKRRLKAWISAMQYLEI